MLFDPAKARLTQFTPMSHNTSQHAWHGCCSLIDPCLHATEKNGSAMNVHSRMINMQVFSSDEPSAAPMHTCTLDAGQEEKQVKTRAAHNDGLQRLHNLFSISILACQTV